MEENKRIWELLNEYGIFTIESFNKAYKENKLKIGMFTGIKERNGANE